MAREGPMIKRANKTAVSDQAICEPMAVQKKAKRQKPTPVSVLEG